MAINNNKYNQKQLADWFTGKAKSSMGYRRAIMATNDRSRSNVAMGRMFFFYYDPKLKKVLPVYDRFPMVFPLEQYEDGFLGLNLHYLNRDERSALLGQLMKFRSDDRMDERTKLRVSYDLLNSTRKLASAMRPCIKRYLYDHVRSSFIEVTADEWDKAIELPVEMFVTKR
jgi:hypothetical protein